MIGVYGVFGMTFSDFEGGTEYQTGVNLADMAKDNDIQHLVFSGGEHTGIPFLDVKYNIEQVRRIAIIWISILTSIKWSLLLSFTFLL